MSSLLCETVSLRVTIATSCDAVCSHNRQDLIQSLVQTHYVWISLSNISIKTNFKQIQHVARVEIKLTNLYNTLSETTFCAWRHVYLLPFILFPSCSLHWRVLPHIPMIWRHDKIVRQRRSRATSRHSFITTVWWYNILYQTGYFL